MGKDGARPSSSVALSWKGNIRYISTRLKASDYSNREFSLVIIGSLELCVIYRIGQVQPAIRRMG